MDIPSLWLRSIVSGGTDVVYFNRTALVFPNHSSDRNVRLGCSHTVRVSGKITNIAIVLVPTNVTTSVPKKSLI